MRLILGTQVYGGSMSIVIGAYVWTSSAFDSTSTGFAGVTIVSGLSAVLSKCRIDGSSASTSTSSGANFLCPFCVGMRTM
jgi:hypothetical protein